jgi:hypothetical protein
VVFLWSVCGEMRGKRGLWMAVVGVPSENGQLSTLSRAGDAKWPESALGEPLASPLIVSGQVDVLPAERRQVGSRSKRLARPNAPLKFAGATTM